MPRKTSSGPLTPESGSCAVCPPILSSDIFGAGPFSDPRLFRSRSAAKRFLRRPVATAGGNKIEGVTYKDQLWYGPVPVVERKDHESSPTVQSGRFQDFLKPEDIGPSQSLTAQQVLDIATKGLPILPSCACYLGLDWDFEAIAREASKGPGHRFEGRQVVSFAHQLREAVCELDNTLYNHHSGFSLSALSDFWQSWQVLRHIADFCRILMADQSLDSDWRRREKIKEARGFVHRQLFSYCQTLGSPLSSAEIRPVPTPPKSPRQRAIDRALERKEWSIPAWATAAKVDRSTAYRFHAGKNPQPATRARMINALELSEDEKQELE